ncbi:MAG: holin family protein [Rhodobacter sp.]|nr:holin family protein [Paracoccaceae bacterium]MCC0075049.1 holin family protein [Rhodobacter sp.]
MGLMTTLLRALARPGALEGAGRTVAGVAEVFRPNATRELELGHEALVAAQSTAAAEFRHAGNGRFDALVNGLNRLPRPMLALGTLGLFVYAMADPAGFTLRMQGLAAVPEPLWWLLGAIVAFYFGARETHYRRALTDPPAPRAAPATPATPPRNPALDDWRAALAGQDP